MAPERLNPDWIIDWLKKPSDILPGTRMPAFWPDYPKSMYTHDLKDFGWLPPSMDGNAEAQIRAIRDHLMTFRGGPSPKANGTKTFFYEQEAPFKKPILESAKESADYLSKLAV